MSVFCDMNINSQKEPDIAFGFSKLMVNFHYFPKD